MKRTVEDIIEIGRELIAVKERLGHGRFLDWIKVEFEMERSTAQNLMNVADKFGDKLPIIGNLKPTVLYALADPSTPDEVIEQATTKAESGEKVTIKDVQEWKQRAEEWRQGSRLKRYPFRSQIRLGANWSNFKCDKPTSKKYRRFAPCLPAPRHYSAETGDLGAGFDTILTFL